jgi:uncharacterized protein YcfJ
MNKSTLAVAIAALLIGGVAVAAYQKFSQPAAAPAVAAAPVAATAPAPSSVADVAQDDNIAATPQAPQAEYADVVGVKPVTTRQQLYATVIGTDPVRETSTTSTPHEVCEDVVVQERLPEKDGNVGGTVAGAVIGGLVGNQVGKGNGRKAATVAGAVAGGFIGNKVDKKHVGGQVVNKTERQCHTETATSTSSKTVAWNVTYRNPNGTTGTMRMGSKPGSRIALGTEDKVVGYDVTYRYDGAEHTVRMDQKPVGDRLPVVDGQVVTQTASADTGTNHG